jgi:hypothetical protein
MKKWVPVGGLACLLGACAGQVVHLGPSNGGTPEGTNGGASDTNGDGGASAGGPASGGVGASSGGFEGGDGGSSGPAQVVPDGAGLDGVAVVEADGATVTGVGYGNPVKFSNCFAADGTIQSGYLFAVPVDLPLKGTVQGLGLITQQSAVVTLGLYALAPAGGLALVAKTASTSIAAGSNLIPTPPTALPGTGNAYWIAAEFQETTTVCAQCDASLLAGTDDIQTIEEPYGTLPSIWFATAAITSGSRLNFFAVIN